jgi:hypothetical protein
MVGDPLWEIEPQWPSRSSEPPNRTGKLTASHVNALHTSKQRRPLQCERASSSSECKLQVDCSADSSRHQLGTIEKPGKACEWARQQRVPEKCETAPKSSLGICLTSLGPETGGMRPRPPRHVRAPIPCTERGSQTSRRVELSPHPRCGANTKRFLPQRSISPERLFGFPLSRRDREKIFWCRIQQNNHHALVAVCSNTASTDPPSTCGSGRQRTKKR